MNEIGTQNRTILFVSHNVNSILTLCNKGILLNKGIVQTFEPIEQCVSRYIQSSPLSGMSWQGNTGDEHIRITRACLRDSPSNMSFFIKAKKHL